MRQMIYLAPMEGITGYVYRNAYQKYFGGVDRYISPFIGTNQKGVLKSRDKNDILPEHNVGIDLVPQILTNRADEFITMARKLQSYGYEEVNLNLGCPSRTVVTKKKGAGFLAHPLLLREFLDTIFEKLDMKVSIKTRLGVEDKEEFLPLLELFNEYPIEMLTIHPRVQTDYYKNRADRSYFDEMERLSKNPVCYNGDIFTAQELKVFSENHPQLSGIMLGRGLLANPGLLEELSEGFTAHDKAKYRAFVDAVCEGYREVIPGDKNVLFKMKEFWSYFACSFTDYRPYAKKIRKTGSFSEYLNTVERLFEEQEVITGAGFSVA